MTNGQEQETKASEGASRRESGLPGGGQGRIDEGYSRGRAPRGWAPVGFQYTTTNLAPVDR